MTLITLPLNLAQAALHRARIAHYYATLAGDTSAMAHWLFVVRFWSLYCKRLRAGTHPRTLQ